MGFVAAKRRRVTTRAGIIMPDDYDWMIGTEKGNDE